MPKILTLKLSLLKPHSHKERITWISVSVQRHGYAMCSLSFIWLTYFMIPWKDLINLVLEFHGQFGSSSSLVDGFYWHLVVFTAFSVFTQKDCDLILTFIIFFRNSNKSNRINSLYQATMVNNNSKHCRYRDSKRDFCCRKSDR